MDKTLVVDEIQHLTEQIHERAAAGLDVAEQQRAVSDLAAHLSFEDVHDDIQTNLNLRAKHAHVVSHVGNPDGTRWGAHVELGVQWVDAWWDTRNDREAWLLHSEVGCRGFIDPDDTRHTVVFRDDGTFTEATL